MNTIEKTHETMSNDEMLEQRLATTKKRIIITVIFSCLGWPVFMYGAKTDYGTDILWMLLGGAIIAAPVLWGILRGGGLKSLFKTDEYEVITTYSDGRKESDGGAQSFILGVAIKIMLAIFMVFVGCVVTLILLIVFTIRYLRLYKKVSLKPAFMQSAFPYLIAGFVVLVGTGYVLRLFGM
jgi:hypothetical protein